jgi:nicotinamide-nucleotide amidase
MHDLNELAETVGRALAQRGLMLVTAESCTGGWIGKVLTDVSGSSSWFERGFVTYSNESKRELIGVSAATLERYGAVSEATVREMAEGALARSRAHVSVAVSGVAGPTGGTAEKPVGTVCFAWSGTSAPTVTATEHFSGDREAVRRQSVVRALSGVLELTEALP